MVLREAKRSLTDYRAQSPLAPIEDVPKLPGTVSLYLIFLVLPQTRRFFGNRAFFQMHNFARVLTNL
jgi:hypothetical protein